MTLDKLRLRRRARLEAARDADFAANFQPHLRAGVCSLQDDMAVANGAGSAVRADVNNQLQALATGQSGTSAPGTTYAYQIWNDTTNALRKQRNAANSGWIIRGALAETLVRAKSSTYNITVSDFGILFDSTGTYSVNLVAVATAGDGFTATVRNSGTGVITLDGNSSETINGATTLDVLPGYAAIIRCNGSLWIANFVKLTQDAYLYYREEQTSGTSAGTFTSGAWRTRVLNTEVNDAGAFGALASNQVTLAAGTYRFRGRAPADRVNSHQVRLANVTDSTYYYGSSAYADAAASVINDSVVAGQFTISASKVFELQHQCQTTHATTGLGYASSFGTEVYAELEFWKVG